MARINGRVFRKGCELFDRAGQKAGVATREVGPADGTGEKRVTGKKGLVVGEVEADTARCMAGGFDDPIGEAGVGTLLPVGDITKRTGGFSGHAIEGGHLVCLGKGPFSVGRVEEDGRRKAGMDIRESGDMVDMGVGHQVGRHGKSIGFKVLVDRVAVAARVDDQTGVVVASAYKAINLKISYYDAVNCHGEIRSPALPHAERDEPAPISCRFVSRFKYAVIIVR